MSFKFLPSSLEKECEKAAATLKSFSEEGVTVDSTSPNETNNKTKARIPRHVLANAIGLVIFSTARIGMHLSGATGSGILVARLPDGSWSPPAGISVLGLSAGIGMGVIVYDCVCVINTKEGLAAFTQKQVSLGSQVSLAAGPWGVSQQGTTEPGENGVIKPVYTYVKTKGFYAGIQVDGTRIGQREDANAAFYGGKVSVEKILKGEVLPQEGQKLYPKGAKVLVDALKSAE